MSVWLREVMGWLLLGTGVAVFGLCYFVFLLNKRILEVGPMIFIGFIIFRGGLHLIKVASAAKAMQDANMGERPTPSRRAYAVRNTNPGETNRSVVPGTRPR